MSYRACDPVPPAGFEPATKSLEGSCSVQLSYEGGVRAGRAAGRAQGIPP
jgi:hypothetical protein